jgi:DNA-binding transcriptional MerR regulator
MDDQRWNLDELAERVDAALAVDYRGQPSGRVRAVPDRRAIRWYTTIGLIDRPVAYRGRTALYGPRHLLQLVAVKRLQARGLPLVAIQQELAGATDTQLARVAHLPVGIVPAAVGADGEPSPTGGATGGRTAARTATGVPRVARAAAARRAGFWRQQPAAAFAARAGDGDATDSAAFVEPGAPTASTDPGRDGGIATLQGVRLGEGATLLLEPGRELDAADVRAILDGAGPLLAALRDRGLGGGAGDPDAASGPAGLDGTGGPASGSRPEPGTPPPPATPAPPAGGNEPRREHP